MLKIELSIIIECPLTDVFDYAADPENSRTWQTGILASKRRSEGPMQVGTIFTEVRQIMGREMDQTMEVTTYERNRRLAFRSIEAAVPHAAELTFASVPGGTRVSLTSIARPAGLMRLAGPFIRRQLQQEFTRDFARLKEILER